MRRSDSPESCKITLLPSNKKRRFYQKHNLNTTNGSLPFLAPCSSLLLAPTYTWFEKHLRDSLQKAHVIGYYTGHSFRRGGATFAFQCGVPASLIKLQGDWRS